MCKRGVYGAPVLALLKPVYTGLYRLLPFLKLWKAAPTVPFREASIYRLRVRKKRQNAAPARASADYQKSKIPPFGNPRL